MPRQITIYDLAEDGRPLTLYAISAYEAIERDPKRYSLKRPRKGAAPTVDEVEESEAEIADADDLTVIKGIGPSFAKKLAHYGITDFRSLAYMTDEVLARIDADLKLYGRATEEQWREQAAAIIAAE